MEVSDYPSKEGPRMEVTKPLIPQQLWLESFDAVLRLNHSGELYANPRAALNLDGTAQFKTEWLLFDQIGQDDCALRWVPKGTAGQVKVRRPSQGNTLQFSAYPLLLERPVLRVAPGRIRIIPYRIDQTETGPLFVLDLSKEENIPSSRRPGGRSPKTKP
jgi:hypothetical protein